MTLEQILRNVTIDMDGEETLLDYCGEEDPEVSEEFIGNIKAQLTPDEIECLSSEISTSDDLRPYIDQEEECWMQIICTAAFLTYQGYIIDDDLRFCEECHVYNIHWNVFDDLYTEYETDIDLG